MRRTGPPGWRAVGVVAAKEWLDAVRDRRTLAIVLLSAVLAGPLMLVLLSTLVGSLETQAEAREVTVSGAKWAPTLVNFIERQGFEVVEAPADADEQVRRQRLQVAVLTVPPGFEGDLAAGRLPVLELVSHSGSARAQGSAAQVRRLVAAFNQDHAQWQLAWRGVAPDAMQAVDLEVRDLAAPGARAQQFTLMLPFFALMAVLYGALSAALDTTAGERERGSLEPLMMNPAPPWALVMGKWAAVALLASLIAALAVLGFGLGQHLLRSPTLAALFRFGPAEALGFMAVLLPLAGGMSAVLMAVAVRCRSVKEAQALTSGVLMVATLLPLVTWLNPGVEARWHLAVPVLAQTTLMNRVLRGDEALGADLALAAGGMALIGALGLWAVSRSLRQAAAGR